VRFASPYHIVEPIYDGRLIGGWHENRVSATRDGDASAGAPARVSFARGGDWIVSKPSLTGPFGALVFRMAAPAGRADFLEVRADSTSSHVFPRVKLRPDHCLDIGDGWVEALVSMAELDPDGEPFDRVVFRSFRDVDAAAVLFDRVGLTELEGDGQAPAVSAAPARQALMRIDCRVPGKAISPLIYGFSYYAMTDTEARGQGQWQLGGTIRRWGGDSSSRYNWELGNATSTGKDWFWENIEVPPYTVFLKGNAEHGVQTALTVPMVGWVAKDTSSVSFSTGQFPDQEKTDPNRPRAGNGKTHEGKDLTPPDPTTTSVPATPDFVRRWVQALRDGAPDRGHGVDIYILDNEPALWSSTHRDVHPSPLTYDELLERTLQYGAAIREVAPDARIAGPAAWGWQEYFFSGKDSQYPTMLRPDRRAHGDVPLLPWYLARLRENEERTKMHVLDLLDVHFYPAAKDIYSDHPVDAENAALRIRSTRGLWDPDYVDESYIREPIRLLPRLHEWIDQNYPGRGIQIGEWNFGGESDMSGGLAVAEALGRFGQYDVTTAFYWTYPPPDSPVTFAFRAYRDFDGKGGHFLDFSLPTSASEGTSLFASRNHDGTEVVAVALNLDPQSPAYANIDMVGSAGITGPRVFSYQGNSSRGFVQQGAVEVDGRHVRALLPPYSITVLDLPLVPTK
jgi:hypothetical protein